MPAYIHRIRTCVPDHAYRQDELREIMKQLVGKTDLKKRVIHQIYSRSGIDTRYSILDDFKPQGTPTLYLNGQGLEPPTGSRNRIYAKHGQRLFLKTAEKVLNVSQELSTGAISHLITISCTGFYAPGPDFDIIKHVGLHPSIERFHLGFMGCYAVIAGLKLATRICESDPGAHVLVVSTELCSLHFQSGNSTDELISASVFSDGAAGVIVSGTPPLDVPCFKINGFASTITGEGENDMAWTIGDTGFNMILSSYIPDILSRNIDDFFLPLLERFNISIDDIGRWAVHPGGRAILDRIEQQLNLPADALRYSRKILSEYGNMSSATILFVLKEILEENKPESNPENIFMMAFGPGLTIESGFLVNYIQ